MRREKIKKEYQSLVVLLFNISSYSYCFDRRVKFKKRYNLPRWPVMHWPTHGGGSRPIGPLELLPLRFTDVSLTERSSLGPYGLVPLPVNLSELCFFSQASCLNATFRRGHTLVHLMVRRAPGYTEQSPAFHTFIKPGVILKM